MPTKIDPSQYSTLIQAVNETYTDGLDAIRSAQVNDDGQAVTAVGVDGQKQLAINMDGKFVTVLLMDGVPPAKFAAAAPGKKKNCKPGSLSCGNACLSMYTASGKKKTCKQPATPAQAAAVATVVQATTGKAPAAAKTPKAPAAVKTPKAPKTPKATTPKPAPAMTPAQQAADDLAMAKNRLDTARSNLAKAQKDLVDHQNYIDGLVKMKVKITKTDKDELKKLQNLVGDLTDERDNAEDAFDKAEAKHSALHPAKKGKAAAQTASSSPKGAWKNPHALPDINIKDFLSRYWDDDVQKAIKYPLGDTTGWKPKMTKAEAAAYTAGTPTGGLDFYHGSGEAAVKSILNDGVDVSKTKVAVYGQGFYMGTSPSIAKSYATGATSGQAAYGTFQVRMHNPAKIYSMTTNAISSEIWNVDKKDKRWAKFFKDNKPCAEAKLKEHYWRSRGYDGVFVEDKGYLVAFDGKQVVGHKETAIPSGTGSAYQDPNGATLKGMAKSLPGQRLTAK